MSIRRILFAAALAFLCQTAVADFWGELGQLMPKPVQTIFESVREELNGGVTPQRREELFKVLQDAVTASVPYENSVDAINDVLNRLGKNQPVTDAEIEQLTKSVACDALKYAITKKLSPALAAKVNPIIDGVIAGGVQGGIEAAADQIANEIAAQLPGYPSAKQVGDVIRKVAKGTLTTADIDNAVNAVAVDSLKYAITKNLEPQVADKINKIIDATVKGGLQGGLNEGIDQAVAQIEQYLPGKDSATAIGNTLKKAASGSLTAADVQTTVNVVAVDTLKYAIGQIFDQETAEKINKIINATVAGGLQGGVNAAIDQAVAEIEQYLPSKASATAIGDTLKKAASGSLTAADINDAVTTVGTDYVNSLLDKADMPGDVRKLAKEVATGAIDGIVDGAFSGGLGGAVTGLRDGVCDGLANYVEDRVSDVLGDQAGKEVRDALVNVAKSSNPWTTLKTELKGLAANKVVLDAAQKYAAGQLDNVIAKCPALSKVCQILGIDGNGIAQTVRNVFDVLMNSGISDKMKALKSMAANGAILMIDNAANWATQWLMSGLVPKAANWAEDLLEDIGPTGTVAGDMLSKLKKVAEKYQDPTQVKIISQGMGTKVQTCVDNILRSL